MAGNGGDSADVRPQPRPHLSWRKIDFFVRLRPRLLPELEQEEERCLEAMLHWHDPVERSRTLRCRRHTLVDDNPTSGRRARDGGPSRLTRFALKL
jgi:hypothetical protein